MALEETINETVDILSKKIAESDDIEEQQQLQGIINQQLAAKEKAQELNDSPENFSAPLEKKVNLNDK